MYYFNEESSPNHKEIKIRNLSNYKKMKVHRSTDNIFGTYRGYTLHSIYNNFLINPYLVRNSKYHNALNDQNQKTQILKYYNNKYLHNKNLNKLNEPINNEGKVGREYSGFYTNHNDNIKPMNYKMEENYNQPPNMKFTNVHDNHNYLTNENYINIKKMRMNEDIKNKSIYENNLKEINDINLSLRSDISNYQENPKKYYNNDMIIERPIEYIIKTQRKLDDSFYINDYYDKIRSSYNNKKRNNRYSNRSVDFTIDYDKEYISPVVAKNAKHHYLMRNPYTEKEEYLGPTSLTNNPILYPISTYKYDYERYLKDYYVNKFK